MTEHGDPSRPDQAVSDTGPAARIPQARLEPAPPPVRGSEVTLYFSPDDELVLA